MRADAVGPCTAAYRNRGDSPPFKLNQDREHTGNRLNIPQDPEAVPRISDAEAHAVRVADLPDDARKAIETVIGMQIRSYKHTHNMDTQAHISWHCETTYERP